jgi:Tfp pilus assembly protein PilO
MIDFKQKESSGLSTVIVASLVVIVASFGFLLFYPKPKIVTDTQAAQAEVQRKIDASIKSVNTGVSIVSPKLWLGNPDTVSSEVLGALTSKANEGSLKLSSFRPQKGQDIAGLMELPFSAQLSGSYESVRDILSALDAPSSKIVLRSAQITATDQGDTEVTAIIGLSAYVPASAMAKAAIISANAAQHVKTASLVGNRNKNDRNDEHVQSTSKQAASHAPLAKVPAKSGGSYAKA